MSGLAGLALAATQARAAGAEEGNGIMQITRGGSQPSQKGPAEYFTGAVRIDPLFQAPDPAPRPRRQRHLRTGRPHRLAYAPARADADCHRRLGRVQREGGPVEEIRPVTWSGFRPARSTGTAPRPLRHDAHRNP